MQKKQTPLPILILFFIIGLFAFIGSMFPTQIEIIPTSTGIQAHIHDKTMGFQDIDTDIPNIKKAIITKSMASKGRTTYRLELEDINGQCFPIEKNYSSEYIEKSRMMDEINDSIKNRVPYKKTTDQSSALLFGLIFMFVPIIISINEKGTKNNTQQQSSVQQTNKPKPIDILKHPKPTKHEQKKYKDINSSIIK